MTAGHIPDNFLRRDIKVDGARPLLFALKLQLDLLEKAETWYVDATFYVIRQLFYRFFTVKAFVRHNDCTKQLSLSPCVSCLGAAREIRSRYSVNCQSYCHVWQVARSCAVLRECYVVGGPCDVIFLTDELNGYGLQVAYASDDGTFKFLRKVIENSDHCSHQLRLRTTCINGRFA